MPRCNFITVRSGRAGAGSGLHSGRSRLGTCADKGPKSEKGQVSWGVAGRWRKLEHRSSDGK